MKPPPTPTLLCLRVGVRIFMTSPLPVVLSLDTFSSRRGGGLPSLEDAAQLQSSSGQEAAGDESHDRGLQEENGGGEEEAVQAHSER